MVSGMENMEGADRGPIRRFAAPSVATLQGLIESGEPFIATDLLNRWPALGWTLRNLRLEYGSCRTCVRMHPATDRATPSARVPFEGECAYCDVTIGEICEWIEGKDFPAAHPLHRFPSGQFIAYCDYQDMADVFRMQPSALAAVDWAPVLEACGKVKDVPRHGTRSTLWLGSQGASTPVHYDSYGINFVAQLQGTKHWRLAPPHSAGIRATRIPYEESSVFADPHAGGGPESETTDGGVAAPDCVGQSAHPEWLHVDLAAGELLHVPRHWWHGVTTTSHCALSVNTWLDTPEDSEERVREGVVRLVVGAMVRAALALREARPHDTPAEQADASVQRASPVEVEPTCGWVNPTEDLGESVAADLALLDIAVRQAFEARHMEACGSCNEDEEVTMLPPRAPDLPALSPLAMARVICLGASIEAAAHALEHRRAASRPASGGTGSSRGGVHLRAPLARVLRCALVGPIGGAGDKDAADAFGSSLERLRAAHGPEKSISPLSIRDVINAVCTGRALDEIVVALVASYRQLGMTAAGRAARKRDRWADTAGCDHRTGSCDCDPSCVIS